MQPVNIPPYIGVLNIIYIYIYTYVCFMYIYFLYGYNIYISICIAGEVSQIGIAYTHPIPRFVNGALQLWASTPSKG